MTALLRQALFAGHCPRAHHRVSKLGDIVSFHAHCCGRHDDKVRPSHPACFICLRLILRRPLVFPASEPAIDPQLALLGRVVEAAANGSNPELTFKKAGWVARPCHPGLVSPQPIRPAAQPCASRHAG